MKLSLPIYAAAFALIAGTNGFAATNSGMGGASVADLTTDAPAVRSDPSTVNYEKYETRSTTRSYSSSGNNTGVTNVRYVTTSQPSSRSQLYRTYTSGNTSSRTATTNRSQTVRTSMKRKYYLAHPFFQPTEGKFGSITDLSYNDASYKMRFTPDPDVLASIEDSGKWRMNQYAVKEDFSFGITDKFAVLLMGRYDYSKYKFDWSVAPTDKDTDSGVNIFGGGLQWRFVDNEKWIATVTGAYERQQDTSNDAILDLKVGYKISKSTIYGIGRGWLLFMDEDMYGNGIKDDNGEQIFIVYDDDAKTTFFGELGLGVFSVLDEDWTLNIEGLFGYYDWHNQASIKGAIGWQPNDWFALNLYGKVSFFDTADGKSLDFYATENGAWMESVSTGLVAPAGKAKLDNYREWSVGAQIIFYF